jgi:hypothetical protein
LLFPLCLSSSGSLTAQVHPNFSGFVLLNLSFSVYCFVDHCLYICLFPFGYCVFCLSSIYGFWLSLWYLLITSLVSSDYLFGIFWLSLWYLLIISLVSSDYLFGIFLLSLWYLLIISLVSSDYLFGIFWLPLWYLQTVLASTYQVFYCAVFSS